MDKEQKDAITKLDEAIDAAQTSVDELRSELQDEFDELTEKQQQSPKGEKLQAELNSLEEASDSISNVLDALRSAVA